MRCHRDLPGGRSATASPYSGAGTLLAQISSTCSKTTNGKANQHDSVWLGAAKSAIGKMAWHYQAEGALNVTIETTSTTVTTASSSTPQNRPSPSSELVAAVTLSLLTWPLPGIHHHHWTWFLNCYQILEVRSICLRSLTPKQWLEYGLSEEVSKYLERIKAVTVPERQGLEKLSWPESTVPFYSTDRETHHTRDRAVRQSCWLWCNRGDP